MLVIYKYSVDEYCQTDSVGAVSASSRSINAPRRILMRLGEAAPMTRTASVFTITTCLSTNTRKSPSYYLY